MSSRAAARLDEVSVQLEGAFAGAHNNLRTYSLIQIEQQMQSGNGDLFPPRSEAQIKDHARTRYNAQPANSR